MADGWLKKQEIYFKEGTIWWAFLFLLMITVVQINYTTKHNKSALEYKPLLQNACKQKLIIWLVCLEIAFIPSLNLISISQTGTDSPECIPGTLHINTLLSKMIPFWENVSYHWAETVEESDAHLPSVKSMCWWQVLESERELLHCSSQQKFENSNRCVWAARREKG